MVMLPAEIDITNAEKTRVKVLRGEEVGEVVGSPVQSVTVTVPAREQVSALRRFGRCRPGDFAATEL